MLLHDTVLHLVFHPICYYSLLPFVRQYGYISAVLKHECLCFGYAFFVFLAAENSTYSEPPMAYDEWVSTGRRWPRVVHRQASEEMVYDPLANRLTTVFFLNFCFLSIIVTIETNIKHTRELTTVAYGNNVRKIGSVLRFSCAANLQKTDQYGCSEYNLESFRAMVLPNQMFPMGKWKERWYQLG